MSELKEIYIKLIDEAIDVWRPIQAIYLHDNVYRIAVDQPYDASSEVWQFEPGTEVICEFVDTDDGRIFAATLVVP